ncbi:GPI inositol-deacylase isoform X2 [Quercus suber]|uniref:GPI inositol-deacylase isoform X2 n=1 Tax=Quercus suber TaxID=58331 RepID=UPI0032DF01F6
MEGFKAKFRVVALIALVIWIGLAALYDLLRPVSNGCIMTYMYPTYIPISASEGVSSAKYGLYLYHEGWRKIDFKEHIKKLSGVPALFIPGNGGSYKQVRSLAAESDRAYQGGPLERTFYQEASLTREEGGADFDSAGFQLPNQYTSKLDWFAVDLEGEHSAMDGGILEEHTEYVVNAIHRVLDQYKESYDVRAKEGAATSGNLPKSVILVGHSMGGFVARAAIIHPRLRKAAVATILTLSSPHQSPPVALQPSLGHYFAHVNQQWKKGYEVQTSHTGHYMSDPILSHVVVVSVSGGYNDYQVRTKLESLDGIVPPTNGFMISSTGMKNVWLSMEHQAILWCNQLVVQVSHTILSLIDSRTGQPFPDTQKRLTILTRMLRSGIPQSFNWMMQSHLASQELKHVLVKDVKDASGSLVHASTACPRNVYWGADGFERDIYIQTTTVTVLAMDGRRRWLDIQKLGSNGKSHFIFVTNLAPCSGVRLHLWPEKGLSTSSLPLSSRVLEVTSKMVPIPSGPAPTQIEPGSQTEQPPPSAVFRLGPEDMHGFRFLTISVAPRPTVSGRPPPAASMAVGQFFNPEEGKIELPPLLMLQSIYSQKDMLVKEDHPLVLNLSFTISLGLLPATLSLETAGCGIKNSGLPDEAGDVENSRLCKLRCFPPVALVWDETSGLHIFPNMYSKKIVVDSSPALWTSTRGSDKTTVLLLVDPHCSYKTSIAVSATAAAGRFLLLYSPQIIGFSIAIILFALMRQARAWDLDLPMPSMVTAVETNLRMPLPFFLLAIVPILVSLFLSFLMSQPFPPYASFIIVSVICYLFANGSVIILVLVSQLVFYVAAIVHIFIKTRWEVWEGKANFAFVRCFINLSSRFFSLKVVRVLQGNPSLVTALAAIILVFLVHPALGLFVLLFSHSLCCHSMLCCHARRKELCDYKNKGNDGSRQFTSKSDGRSNQRLPLEENSSNSPDSSKSFGDTQLEVFHHRHGLLILHLVAALMFVPSLAACLQRMGMGQSFPWFLDTALCTGVILHGICLTKPEFNCFLFSFPSIRSTEVRLDFIYLVAGYYSFLCGLALVPDRVFYIMAAIGIISFALRIVHRRNIEKGEVYMVSRKHSHRH